MFNQVMVCNVLFLLQVEIWLAVLCLKINYSENLLNLKFKTDRYWKVLRFLKKI